MTRRHKDSGSVGQGVLAIFGVLVGVAAWYFFSHEPKPAEPTPPLPVPAHLPTGYEFPIPPDSVVPISPPPPSGGNGEPVSANQPQPVYPDQPYVSQFPKVTYPPVPKNPMVPPGYGKPQQ